MEEQLYKYLTGETSVTEKDELFDRINANEDNRQEYARLQILTALSSMTSQNGDEEWSSLKMNELYGQVNKKRYRRLIFSTLKYASVILLAVIGTWFITTYDSGNDQSSYTQIDVPAGQRVHMTLADGTNVWLSPRTKMNVPNRFNEDNRTIELDGEGYFSVSKDPKRPFIVKTQKYNVKVLGTKFNVFSYSKSPRFETDLVEGSVHVYNKDNQDDGLILKPNEKAYLENNSLVKIPHIFDNEEFLKNGIFRFTGVPFSEILNYLSLWYNVEFELARATNLDRKVSGKFRQSDEIQYILKALQGVHKFKFKMHENDNRIEIY
ncbi:FecR family protein [uncultured Parabacteroides sp.]|jgi:ferric-dicitrate binding protein FerR (iron transport regulator)|uniref:FecR family protein n=1 Tax=uncultured Parabacteroides sp. TaxID=512312 RepID=UPI0025EAA0C5|nr:FecR family protein [uncultured Parabacteroides sp.]